MSLELRHLGAELRCLLLEGNFSPEVASFTRTPVLVTSSPLVVAHQAERREARSLRSVKLELDPAEEGTGKSEVPIRSPRHGSVANSW